MVRKILLISLFAQFQLSAISAVFPEVEFAGASESLFSQLQSVYDKNARQASRLAFDLRNASRVNSEKEKQWSDLIYAFLLLENDSIGKALSVLSDTSRYNYEDAENELAAFQKLVIGSALNYNAEYRRAEMYLRDGLDLKPSNQITTLLKQKLANNLRYQGRLEEGYVVALEGLEISKKLNDSSRVVDGHFVLGLIEFTRGEYESAERSLELVHSYYRRKENSTEVADALSVLGLISYRRDDFREAIDKGLQSYQIRKIIGDRKGQGESLNNLALSYMGQKNWNQALRYLEDALLLKTASNDLSQLTVILNNIGQCHIALGNTEKAIQVFQQALEKALENGQLRDALRSQSKLVRIHAEKNDFETAFRLQQARTALKDSLVQIENNRTIQDLKVRYETQRKEDALNLLQKENAIVTNRWLTLALGLFFLLILGILIYDNQRRKHRQQTDLMTAEDELQKAELKIMTEVLEHNQQKLKLYTENLLKKNELVEELETKLQIGSDRAGDGNDKRVQKKIRSVRILTDDDWEEFKELFDGVHEGLLDRLLSNYEDLTLAEQRLFLLMKLSMSTKQIANILGVSPDSVKKGRYRLKKKLRIENDMTLNGFVDQFI